MALRRVADKLGDTIQAMKTMKAESLPLLHRKAQQAFNRFIRERDQEKGCISCGGSVDHAGHYFSQGRYTHLRYDEMNVNGQCVGCNLYKSGNLILYRMGLINRYGEEQVRELERRAIEDPIRRWGREELRGIINRYRE